MLYILDTFRCPADVRGGFYFFYNVLLFYGLGATGRDIVFADREVRAHPYVATLDLNGDALITRRFNVYKGRSEVSAVYRGERLKGWK